MLREKFPNVAQQHTVNHFPVTTKKVFGDVQKEKHQPHPYNTVEKNTQKIVKIMKKLKSMDKIVNAMIIQFWNEKRS